MTYLLNKLGNIARRYRRYMCILLSVMSLTALAVADAPPSWQPFKICTAVVIGSPQYCASIERSGSLGRAEQSAYRLLVRKFEGGSSELLWQREYDYDGYPSAALAPDGRTFLYVNYWYSETNPVLKIYQEDARYEVDGSAFDIPKAALKQTASHHLWLDAPAEISSSKFLDAKRFYIRTIDAQEWILELSEGCHLHKKSQAESQVEWKHCDTLEKQ